MNTDKVCFNGIQKMYVNMVKDSISFIHYTNINAKHIKHDHNYFMI
jgi:hypothetical protein